MKIRVITRDFEYQGLYAGSEHEVESHAWISRVDNILYSFKVNGKRWKLYEGECEEVPAPNEKLMDVISTDLKKEECRSSYCECEDGKCSGGKVDMRADEVEKVKTKDMVNSPSHYALFDNIEAIQVIAASMTKEMFKGYCFGNLLKYKLRAGGKDDIQQELKKADKYKELYEKYQHLCKQN